MDLDRSRIEKRDFPVKRRGYDQRAVAAHLAALADDVDVLRRSARPESLSGTASDRVRLIVEAAERGAAELTQEAEAERSEILAGARREAGEHLARVAESTASMLERAAVLEQEFAALLAAVRASAATLTHELRSLEGSVQELRARPPAPLEERNALRSDDEGARLVALNMALNGTPREETGRYLSEHFDAGDVDGVLDDVYVRAEQ